jgi:putative transcriptional regulator
MARSISKLIGHLLVATPSLIDTHFSKSVIYICEHDEKGILGIMINKPLGIPIQRIFDQLGIDAQSNNSDPGDPHRQDVMMGGPVETDHGFILYHRSTPSNSIQISDSRALLSEIAQGKGPERFIVSLGYAGWEPKQLGEEIRRNDWLVVPISDTNSKALLFDTPAKDRWNTAINLLGYPPHAISTQVGHA